MEGAKKSEYEVKLMTTEDTTTYKTADIFLYGHNFKREEWDFDKDYEVGNYHPGRIFLQSGKILKGDVKVYKKESGFGLTNYPAIFLDQKNVGWIRQYRPEELEKVEMDIDGQVTTLDRFKFYLVEPDYFYSENIAKNPKDYGRESPVPAEIIWKDKTVTKGELIFTRGKKKTKAMFYIQEDKDLISLNYNDQWEAFKATREGKIETYVYYDEEFQEVNELKEYLLKKDRLKKAELFLTNKNSVDGQVIFSDKDQFISAYVFLPELDYPVQYDDAEVEKVEVIEEGKPNTYMKTRRAYVNIDEIVAELEEESSSDPTEELHPGYLVMTDNSKKEGRIIRTREGEIYFIDQNKTPKRYQSKAEDLAFYIQMVNGEKKKFVGMKKRAKVFGGDHIFQEIIFPFERFSYYQNPHPTHQRKGITKLGSAVGNAVSAGLEKKFAEAQAADAAKNNYNETGNLSSAIDEAGYTYETSIKNSQGAVSFSDSDENVGVFFEEFVVFDNETGDSFVIFKENDQEVMDILLSRCPAFDTVDDKEQKKMTKVTNLEESLVWLNTCK